MLLVRIYFLIRFHIYHTILLTIVIILYITPSIYLTLEFVPFNYFPPIDFPLTLHL